MRVGSVVIYRGAFNEQIRWGNNDDPRPLLTIGSVYIVSDVEVHSWHTKIQLEGYEGHQFNSVAFEEI